MDPKSTYKNGKVKNNYDLDTIHSSIENLTSFSCNYTNLEYNFFTPTL
jgi:hypothetical protein